MTLMSGRWPTTPADISPEWVSLALSERFPGTVVSSVEIPDIVQGSAVKAHIRLTYADGASNGLPASMYLKGGLGGPMAAVASGAYVNEARFFADVADQLAVEKPRHFYAGVVEDASDGLVLLEDLSERATFGRAVDGPFEVELVARAVEMQAGYHAAFWESSEAGVHEWMRPDSTHLREFMLNVILSKENWDKHLALRAEVVPEAVRNRDAVIDAIAKMWAINDAAPRTLIHADPHQDNFFVTHDGSPALLDWQTAQFGTWAHDVSYTIIGCLSIEDRRANLDALVRHYLAALERGGVRNAPTFTDAMLAIRQNVWHSFCWWLTPVEMQPDKTSRIVGERFTTAAVDLDSFEAVA